MPSSTYDRSVRASLDIVYEDQHDAYQAQTCEISMLDEALQKFIHTKGKYLTKYLDRSPPLC
jgi:hypothetical protein